METIPIITINQKLFEYIQNLEVSNLILLIESRLGEEITYTDEDGNLSIMDSGSLADEVLNIFESFDIYKTHNPFDQMNLRVSAEMHENPTIEELGSEVYRILKSNYELENLL
jgi:hypothetical protein